MGNELIEGDERGSYVTARTSPSDGMRDRPPTERWKATELS